MSKFIINDTSHFGFFRVILLLVICGFVSFFVTACQKEDSLKQAIQQNNIPEIQRLLALKPNLEPECAQNQICKPLAYAAQFGNLDVIKLLVEAGANPNGKNAYDDTAFITVDHAKELAQKSDEDIRSIRMYLLDHGIDANQPNSMGITPLMGIAALGDIDMMERAVRKGANINFSNNSGWTVLMGTAQFNQPEAAKWLLQHGAEPLQKDNNGKTAYDYALQYNKPDVANVLKSFGGDRKN